jgi:hypothetical protein
MMGLARLKKEQAPAESARLEQQKRERKAAGDEIRQNEPEYQNIGTEQARLQEEYQSAPEQESVKSRFAASTLFCVLGWDVCLYL